MTWGYTKDTTIDTLKNKSIEARKLFSEIANKALADGKDEESAIFAGTSAVAMLERQKAREIKKAAQEQKELELNTPVPFHLQAIKEAAELKKQQVIQEEIQANQEFVEKVTSVVKENQPTIEISSVYFDNDGKLVLNFSDGRKVKSSNSVPEQLVNSNQIIVTENTPATQELKEVNPVFTYDVNGNVSRIDYESGNYKTFIYVNGLVDQLDYVMPEITLRKNFIYDGSGNVLSIVDTSIAT